MWSDAECACPIVTGTSPWVTRVSDVKARAAVNVEAERRVVQLNDEIQALVRNLKSKDQNIQESSVKIELMERRMETVRKQADTINDLESELGKARKQEKSYEEAIDQLQHDLDALEQDNIKLKALANNPERQGLGPLFQPFGSWV
jgi:dynactin 1